MLKIGIIGCGRIADQHAVEIVKLKNARIIGVCDKEELMAQQLADRFDVSKHYTDVAALLNQKPDIVHITTPPQSHYSLGKICLEAGCHVFMEKPFTVTSEETNALIELAERKGLKVTVGHNAQFSHAAMRMRKLIQSGFLGGDPMHMESTWCYPFTDPGYAKAILGDSNHWIRSLPGRYLHDILSHGISRIAEFLKGDNPTIIAHGSVSPLLMSIREDQIIDELRVIIDDNENTTAYYTFSSQMVPPIKRFRVYGPKNSLTVDHEHQTVVKASKNYTYYLNHFISPIVDAKEYFGNAFRNIYKFLLADFHFESGRNYLIKAFYQSVKEGAPLPITYREIRLTSKIMDEIFDQIY